MKGRHVKLATIPSMEEVDKERQRLEYRNRYVRVLKSTVYALVVVAAAAVLLATILLPVLQVSGDSMNPTLRRHVPWTHVYESRVSVRLDDGKWLCVVISSDAYDFSPSQASLTMLLLEAGLLILLILVVVHRVVNVMYRGLTSRWYIDTIPNLPYASEELGKTTFLTREEAERALEAKKDE